MKSETNGTGHGHANGSATLGTATAGEEILDVKSDEYRVLNGRRCDLIYKRNREGLTIEEEAEYGFVD